MVKEKANKIKCVVLRKRHEIPSIEPASLRTFLATEMTSGPMPSPGRRVMEYRFGGVAAEQRIVANLIEEGLESDFD